MNHIVLCGNTIARHVVVMQKNEVPTKFGHLIIDEMVWHGRVLTSMSKTLSTIIHLTTRFQLVFDHLFSTQTFHLQYLFHMLNDI